MSFSPLSNSNSMPQKDMQRHYSFDRDTEEKHEILGAYLLKLGGVKGYVSNPRTI